MVSVHAWPRRMAGRFSRAAAPRAAGNSLSVTSPSTDKPVRNRISKNEILRGFRAFGHVLSRGTYVKHRGIRLYCDIKREIPPYRCTVGFAVRKAESAVQRNRLRRLLRESYRQRKHGLLQRCIEQRLQLRCVFLVDARNLDTTLSFQTVDASVAFLLDAATDRLRQ
jgi:ribonuclease P protein component